MSNRFKIDIPIEFILFMGVVLTLTAMMGSLILRLVWIPL